MECTLRVFLSYRRDDSTPRAGRLRDETWHDDIDRLVRVLGGTPHQRPHSSRLLLLAAAVGVAVSAAAVAVWVSRGEDGDATGATTTNRVATTEFDPVTATPPECGSTAAPDVVDLRMRGRPDEQADEQRIWEVEVVDAFHREAGLEEWNLAVHTRLTNHNAGSMWHYPFYALIVDGEELTPSCFSVVSGPRLVDPSGTSDALVGFAGPEQAPQTMALQMDDAGDRYRIDLTVGG